MGASDDIAPDVIDWGDSSLTGFADNEDKASCAVAFVASSWPRDKRRSESGVYLEIVGPSLNDSGLAPQPSCAPTHQSEHSRR